MTDSYSHDMIRSHEIRSLGALLFLVSRVQARVDRQLAVVWLRRGAATAFAHRGCIRQPTDRSLLILLYVPRAAAVFTRLCSARFVLLC